MRRSNKAAVRTEPAEVAEAAASEVEAQEEAEEEVAITINISAVLTYKVMTAKSKADVVFTSMWLVCGIFFAGVAVIALLAIGVGSQWPHCFEQTCRAGTVCVSSPKQFGAPPDYRKGVEGFTTPTCQDCYFTRESRVQRQTLTNPNPNLSAPDDSVAVGILYGTDTTTAGEFCFNKLNELGNASFASKEPAFARCLYVQKTFGLASKLDWFILRAVFLLVAMSMAEAQRQQQLICRLRRILLPLPCHMPLRPKNMTTGSILRRFGILLLTINEFIISLTAPMLPFGVVFLMLTQGIEASPALLNGLAMGFVLQIDNLVPSKSSYRRKSLLRSRRTSSARPCARWPKRTPAASTAILPPRRSSRSQRALLRRSMS